MSYVSSDLEPQCKYLEARVVGTLAISIKRRGVGSLALLFVLRYTLGKHTGVLILTNQFHSYITKVYMQLGGGGAHL